MRRTILTKGSQILTGALLALLFSCSTAEIDDDLRIKLSECTDKVCIEIQKERLRQQGNNSGTPTANSKTNSAKTGSTGTSNSMSTTNAPQGDGIIPELYPAPVYVEPWEPRATFNLVAKHCAICHSDWVGNKAQTRSRRNDSINRIQSGNMPRNKILSAAERQILINALRDL
jgi:hypothetical protein